MTFIPKPTGAPDPLSFFDINCSDKGTFGLPSFRFDYAVKGLNGANSYPSNACKPWLHYNLKVNILRATTDIISPGVFSLRAKARYWDSKKSFDIPHPTKDDHRLRYICLEGPSAEVFYRGKLKNESIINLPDYWRELVDIDTIGVTLTPRGTWQELYVEKIEWGTTIHVKNNSASKIDCDYVVYAERKDTSKNIPEYKGLTPEEYPGDNSEYVINGK